jgi:hypothetical protein
MTATNELDRLLGEWLEEGPRRAPDRPIELAVEHARSHPRRRDPFGFLRPDPMAPRAIGFGARPVLVLAILGLLLAAVVAVGVGSRGDAPIVQPVGPSVSPTPSSEPSASPPPSLPAVFPVDLDVPVGQPQTVEVIDASGLVVEATSGSPTGESGTTFPFDEVAVANLDATTLQLGWSGFPCATDHTLAVGANGRSMTLTRPDCTGDTDPLAVDRILVLRFATPVEAADVDVVLQP